MNERGEITSCKSHIAPVSLTDWCTIIIIIIKYRYSYTCKNIIYLNTVYIGLH